MKFIDASDPAFRSAAEVGAFKGAVKNLSNNEYHALKNYWSSTDLKYMAGHSPRHFKEKYFGPATDAKKQNDDMILGSLVHCMLLTPGEFEKDFFKMPDLNFRTNEGKAERERLLTENKGKTPITDELLATAQCMRESALSNPEIRKLLEPGIREAAYFWTCPFSGLNMKAKLDQSCREWFVELKTTSDASPENFSRHAFNMHYDLSLVHYREGLRITKDGITPPAYFIVIENELPYVNQVYLVGQGYWETGHAKWLDAVTKLSDGMQKQNWPGYFNAEMGTPELNPPAWAVNKTLPKGMDNGV